MVAFHSDYIKGAHPKVLEQLAQTNLEAHGGYGDDEYCRSAAEKIRLACACPHADVFFAVGGTQANALVISSLTKEYQGVIAASTGHVANHEAGAIEATGRKVMTLSHRDGKIVPEELDRYLSDFFADENREHMVQPGMVYISHPTEYGTLYSYEELRAIAQICHRREIPLYMDGARLAYALESYENDVALSDVAALCDVFTFGGTKAGTLCGEAIIFTKKNKPEHFLTIAKRRGALLSKGRLLGIQFDALFTDALYSEIGRHAIEAAEKMKQILREKGYRFYVESPTNQQFIVVSDAWIDLMSDTVGFSFWERIGDKSSVIRLATSWSTTDEDLEKLRAVM